jgi:hypothetical protein
MAIVGDPGNHSVRVIQTFGGPKGQFVTFLNTADPRGRNTLQLYFDDLDTLAPQPPGYNFLRDWHYYHGDVANAPAYQLEISAFGYNSGDPAIERIYPWYGFRVGVIGTP